MIEKTIGFDGGWMRACGSKSATGSDESHSGSSSASGVLVLGCGFARSRRKKTKSSNGVLVYEDVIRKFSKFLKD